MTDRTRIFKLPRIQDLSKEQEAALARPLDGQHLIVGGPGTGKSVVALLRANKLAREPRDYVFLVYNHLLRQSNLHLFGGEQRLVAATWDTWIRQHWRELMNEDIPTIEPSKPSDYRAIDWVAVDRAIHIPPSDVEVLTPPCVIIDEGQDMPPAFYNALVALGFEHFYVVADQNQQIHPERCSSRMDIENALAIESNDTLELKQNYRNSHSVARLARAFYTGDPASPPPDLPPESPSATTPELITYGRDGGPSFQQIMQRILQLADRSPRKLIGIITPNNDVRKRFVNGLTQTQAELDNGRPPINTYASGRQEPLDFGQGGIMVINAQSCKGLEFDIAILADIDQHRSQDEYALKSRFYVMVARARERVTLLRTAQQNPVVEAILPNDPTILAR
jgi:superfamily I DNA/RNA helicase